MRILFALARGTVIVGANWIWDSLEKNQWVDTQAHLSKRYACSMLHATMPPLADKRFHVLHSKAVTVPHLETLISAAGGTIMPDLYSTQFIVFGDKNDVIEWMVRTHKPKSRSPVVAVVHFVRDTAIPIVFAKVCFAGLVGGVVINFPNVYLYSISTIVLKIARSQQLELVQTKKMV